MLLSPHMVSIETSFPDPITGRCFNNNLATRAPQHLFQFGILAELQIIPPIHHLITRPILFRLIEWSAHVSLTQSEIVHSDEVRRNDTSPACLPKILASPGASAAKIFLATTSSPNRSAFLYII